MQRIMWNMITNYLVTEKVPFPVKEEESNIILI